MTLLMYPGVPLPKSRSKLNSETLFLLHESSLRIQQPISLLSGGIIMKEFFNTTVGTPSITMKTPFVWLNQGPSLSLASTYNLNI